MLINGKVGINGKAGKNTAIRNSIEIKPSNNLVKISTKRTHEIQRKFIYIKNHLFFCSILLFTLLRASL